MFLIPSPYRKASGGQRLLAGSLWLGVLYAGYRAATEVGGLLQLPARPVRSLLGGPLALAVALAALVLLWTLWRRADARHWTKWWDPAWRPDGPINWGHVLGLVRDDPLKHVPRFRPWHFLGRSPLYVLILAAVSVLVWSLICLIDRPWLPDMLRAQTAAGTVFLQLTKPNLAAYLALLAAAASIFFAYVQLRAKVRADNRQAWIDRARAHLAAVTSLGLIHADAAQNEAPELWEKFAPLRVELELMLNPSESDHRLLAFLLHELALLRRGKGPTIEDSENLKEVIEIESGRNFDAWLPGWAEKRQLVTYILRLSHVVLKREWERVKHTR